MTSTSNFTVTAPGNVDVIGSGDAFDLIPGNGAYIDLGGTYPTAPSGPSSEDFVTNQSFPAGNYTINLVVAGNRRPADAPGGNAVSASFGGLLISSTQFNPPDGPVTLTATGASTGGQLTITNVLTNPSDNANVGALLLSVEIIENVC